MEHEARNKPPRTLSRRSFLGKTFAAGVLGFAGLPDDLWSAGDEAITRSAPRRATRKAELPRTRRTPLRISEATADDFRSVLGSRFRVRDSEGKTRRLVLTEVRISPEDSNRPRGSLRREPFSLLFRRTDGVEFVQETYHLRHPKLGRLELFLVPVGPFSDGSRLEAVFN